MKNNQNKNIILLLTFLGAVSGAGHSDTVTKPFQKGGYALEASEENSSSPLVKSPVPQRPALAQLSPIVIHFDNSKSLPEPKKTPVMRDKETQTCTTGLNTELFNTQAHSKSVKSLPSNLVGIIATFAPEMANTSKANHESVDELARVKYQLTQERLTAIKAVAKTAANLSLVQCLNFMRKNQGKHEVSFEHDLEALKTCIALQNKVIELLQKILTDSSSDRNYSIPDAVVYHVQHMIDDLKTTIYLPERDGHSVSCDNVFRLYLAPRCLTLSSEDTLILVSFDMSELLYQGKRLSCAPIDFEWFNQWLRTNLDFFPEDSWNFG